MELRREMGRLTPWEGEEVTADERLDIKYGSKRALVGTEKWKPIFYDFTKKFRRIHLVDASQEIRWKISPRMIKVTKCFKTKIHLIPETAEF
ncbi:hypothetical protein AVEN_109622-1 [Araneus ventricosus]|uniref:Uncharacterized protein n=1 Tax=Araneus ventricosus TaxID=182803 RepID=A0A4Y2FTR9_ARAVE|nr:hypothetical protein AVEN_109622-1 [Araneus ventricosus]